jgi:hypothetical protein
VDQLIDDKQAESEKTIAELIQLRVQIKTALQRLETEQLPYRDGLAKVDAKIIAAMDANGLNSIKTEHGTAYFSTLNAYSITDRKLFFDWMIENDATDILTSHVSKEALREREQLPPGIAVTNVRRLNIRGS